jgi:hypothetical protein
MHSLTWAANALMMAASAVAGAQTPTEITGVISTEADESEEELGTVPAGHVSDWSQQFYAWTTPASSKPCASTKSTAWHGTSRAWKQSIARGSLYPHRVMTAWLPCHRAWLSFARSMTSK